MSVFIRSSSSDLSTASPATHETPRRSVTPTEVARLIVKEAVLIPRVASRERSWLPRDLQHMTETDDIIGSDNENSGRGAILDLCNRICAVAQDQISISLESHLELVHPIARIIVSETPPDRRVVAALGVAGDLPSSAVEVEIESW
jgi:hypothetical protein